MTDTVSLSSAAGISYPDASDRGTLVVRPRAVERIAVAAARATDDVVRRSGGIRRLSGKDLPTAEVSMIGTSVRARVVVAVEWPTPAAAIAERVRDAVARGLEVYGDVQVDRVDVAVQYVSPGDTTTKTAVSTKTAGSIETAGRRVR